jgi:hypothetical protein
MLVPASQEELSVIGQELHEQTAKLTATRQALETERERYQAQVLLDAGGSACGLGDRTAWSRRAG